MGDTGQQQISTGLITFADHECQDQAPDRGKGDPHPGVPIGFAIDLGTGQMRLLGMHETPQLVELAFAHMQIVPEGQHDGATVACHPMQPGTDRILIHEKSRWVPHSLLWGGKRGSP